MPLLSIIIPVYNVENYLRKCLDSVICPGISDYEIICVNDGSTDSCPEILADYAAKYPGLINLIDRKNGGVGDACNAGIQNACGKYITFLDSDDYYCENAVSEILAECRGNDDIIIFDMLSVKENGEKISLSRGCARCEGEFSLEEYPQLLMDYPSRVNKIFRRELFSVENISFPARVWFEDYRIIPRLYPHCRNIKYIRRAWYNYVQQPSSITHSPNLIRNLEITEASDEILAYYKKLGLFSKYREELEYMVYYNAVLTSVDRVNLADKESPVQAELLEYYINRFPDFRKNKYFKEMGPKYAFLSELIIKKKFRLLNLVLNANSLIKRK